MKIYVTSLSDYNAGRLHGAWIDVVVNVEDMLADIHKMLEASPEPGAEEWRIDDIDTDGATHHIITTLSLDVLSNIAALTDHCGDEAAALCFYDLFGETEIDQFEDAYLGKITVEDYALELAENLLACHSVPPEVARYFNYKAYARDILLSGDVTEHEGHLFLSGGW